MDFPENFEPEYYRKRYYKFLKKASDSKLLKHYQSIGREQGLIPNRIESRLQLFDYVDLDLNALEIGPLHLPLLDHSRDNVKSIDISTKQELMEAYKDDESVNQRFDNIPETDYIIGKSGLYLEAMKEHPIFFDYIISSHNIEHVPCLIGFLNNCSSVLKSKGYVVLLIPDSRFIFDKYRTPTTLIDILVDYYLKQNRIGLRHVLETAFLHTKNNPGLHWKNYT